MKSHDEDPILNGALEEVLGGRTPPDLTARILQAWAVQRSENGSENGSANGVARAVDQARTAAQLPPAVGLNVPIPVNGSKPHAAPLPLAEGPVVKRRRKFPWEVAAAFSSVAAIAGLLAVAIWPQLNRPNVPVAQPHENHSGKNGPKIVEKHPPAIPGNQIAKPEEKPNGTKPAPPAIVHNEKPNSPPEETPSPNFPVRNPQENPAPQVVDNTPSARATIEPLPAKKLIEFVNLELKQAWTDNKVTPAPLANDSEWCRRVFVRVIGRIPTVEELNAFTKDPSTDRREKLVTQLLESDKYAAEFNQHWAGIWTNVLVGRVAGTEANDPVRRDALQTYLADAFARRLPYDQLVTELLTATGSTASSDVKDGAINFLLSGFQEKDATVATNRVSRIFLGVNLQCAQRHNHPTNDWHQADYWSLNAFLRQIPVERSGKDARLYDRDLVAQSGDAA